MVDAMFLVQRMSKKQSTIMTVKDLSQCFNEQLMHLTGGFNEVIAVFDTYKGDSLKNKKREKR